MLTKDLIDAEPAPPPRRIVKLQDGDGLFLQIQGNRRGWRFRYRFAGKDSLLSFGPYETVTIEDAREKAKAARKQLLKGENPAVSRRQERDRATEAATNTFGRAGAAYLAHTNWRSGKTVTRNQWLYSELKKFHNRPLDSIEPPDIVRACEAYYNQGKQEKAHRMQSFISRVYRYAVQQGFTKHNPTRDLRGALKPVQTESHAGITDPKAFGALMRFVDGDQYFNSSLSVRHALRFLARVFVRPGKELLEAEWREVDFGKAEWRIPASRTKMRREHVVPLAPQVIEILEAQRAITGEGRYIFPTVRSAARPMSNGTLGAALKAFFYEPSEHVPHGFRVTASSLLHEAGFDPAIIELQLQHIKGDVAGIYDRSQRLPERRAMLIRWCEMIEEFKA